MRDHRLHTVCPGCDSEVSLTGRHRLAGRCVVCGTHLATVVDVRVLDDTGRDRAAPFAALVDLCDIEHDRVRLDHRMAMQ